MAKSNVTYKCSECGATFIQKLGKCSQCGKFGTINPIEAPTTTTAGLKTRISTTSERIVVNKANSIKDIISSNKTGLNGNFKTQTGLTEFDKVLDGGVVQGQVILIGAEPGFGKTTLSMQALNHLAQTMPVLYASGEENVAQVAARAERIHATNSNMNIMASTLVEDIIAEADRLQVKALCVDSLQAVASEGVEGSFGSISQSKEAAMVFRKYAKDSNTIIILISQFNKNDEVAGSNQIPHAVDTILVGDADNQSQLKFLRCVKNRYGRTNLTGVFVHENDGLKSVENPSEYLMGSLNDTLAGAARTIINDGGRLLAVEVDALVAPAQYSSVQRQFNGVSQTRGRVLTARLSVSMPILKLDTMDVFVNTMNGISFTDPMSDLSVVASIASGILKNQSAKPTVFLGEVSLTGQVRGQNMIAQRVEEAARLGFERVVCSKYAMDSIPKGLLSKIEVKPIKMVQEVLKYC